MPLSIKIALIKIFELGRFWNKLGIFLIISYFFLCTPVFRVLFRFMTLQQIQLPRKMTINSWWVFMMSSTLSWTDNTFCIGTYGFWYGRGQSCLWRVCYAVCALWTPIRLVRTVRWHQLKRQQYFFRKQTFCI